MRANGKRAPQDMSVRARAPLRLGLAGGGTDLSPFCDMHGGFVMNATVNLYAYAHLTPRTDGRVLFQAAEQNTSFEAEAAAEFPHDPRALLHCGVYNHIIREFNRGEPLPVTIRTTVDVPQGSGMGGSSALVVALIEAFRCYLGISLGEYDIARLAYEIERTELGLSGGKQDQYAAAFGGFNFMEFYAENRVIINPLRLNPSTIRELEASILLYFTGQSRHSAIVIQEQQNQVASGNRQSMDAMFALKREATEMKEALLTNRLDRAAETLLRGWQAKKSTASGVTNPQIDRILELSLENGGLAGKISGAGGGGFVMLLCNPTEKYKVANLLRQERGQLLPCTFTQEGVTSWFQLF